MEKKYLVLWEIPYKPSCPRIKLLGQVDKALLKKCLWLLGDGVDGSWKRAVLSKYRIVGDDWRVPLLHKGTHAS